MKKSKQINKILGAILSVLFVIIAGWLGLEVIENDSTTPSSETNQAQSSVLKLDNCTKPHMVTKN